MVINRENSPFKDPYLGQTPQKKERLRCNCVKIFPKKRKRREEEEERKGEICKQGGYKIHGTYQLFNRLKYDSLPHLERFTFSSMKYTKRKYCNHQKKFRLVRARSPLQTSLKSSTIWEVYLCVYEHAQL
ncbi:hypothetical protein AVEN_67126-1 [Araneus ventricosus]|uniref:Uncharacterized protein n=1 Tax=Araneus ventricosus TaxID=182803 RepID=A0A4Y2THE7_ARAVE|nr:hypothetical protein AVEN_67126-1 [Araneus ventricosus]